MGARAKRVVPLVLGRSMIAAFLGLGVGVACAFASTRVLQAFLFQTEARDLSTFVWGTILLFGTVLIASYLPARRALGIDPIEVLRAE